MELRKINPLSSDALLAGFRAQGFALVPFAISPKKIQEAIGNFFAFLALPQDVKNPLTYKHTTIRRGGRAGYIRSSPEKGKLDQKEVMQYHPSVEIRFREERQRIPEFNRLLTSMREIYLEGEALTRAVVSSLEHCAPGIIDQFFPEDQYPFFHLRFLKYDLLPEGQDLIAASHYDIGSLTLAISESGPGLHIGGDEGTPMQPIEHHPNKAVVMAGYNLPQEIPEQGIMSAWHNVAHVPGLQVNQTTARWSIVMFNDTADSQSCTLEESHTRRGSVPTEAIKRLA